MAARGRAGRRSGRLDVQKEIRRYRRESTGSGFDSSDVCHGIACRHRAGQFDARQTDCGHGLGTSNDRDAGELQGNAGAPGGDAVHARQVDSAPPIARPRPAASQA